MNAETPVINVLAGQELVMKIVFLTTLIHLHSPAESYIVIHVIGLNTVVLMKIIILCVTLRCVGIKIREAILLLNFVRSGATFLKQVIDGFDNVINGYAEVLIKLSGRA